MFYVSIHTCYAHDNRRSTIWQSLTGLGLYEPLEVTLWEQTVTEDYISVSFTLYSFLHV